MTLYWIGVAVAIVFITISYLFGYFVGRYKGYEDARIERIIKEAEVRAKWKCYPTMTVKEVHERGKQNEKI